MRANNLSEIRNAISEDISNSKSKHRQEVRDLRYTKNRSLLNLRFSRHKRRTRSRPGATFQTSVTSIKNVRCLSSLLRSFTKLADIWRKFVFCYAFKKSHNNGETELSTATNLTLLSYIGLFLKYVLQSSIFAWYDQPCTTLSARDFSCADFGFG